MKFIMVACINILYMENWSSAGCRHQQKFGVTGFVFFTRFRPLGINLQYFFSSKG